ncbi:MAG: hypothetical protein WC735_01200 [Candidatus Paceibacterota bacterium]|jgi:mRNA-degrading endonuclease RelE of RelBE toxin-antitoxin system
MKVAYTPAFIKQFNTLSKELQEEVLAKIELFKDRNNHKMLKVHKLHGKHSSKYSFSIDYKNRIVFMYLTKQEIICLFIGDHDIYK